MPRIKVKPLADISKHYRESSSTAASRYKDSIDQVEWQENAIDGQDLYEERMRDPEVLARRETGIRTVTDSEFKDAMRDKGASRIGPGILAGVDKQREGYRVIRDALDGMELPARVADPMANIDNRLKPVVKAQIEAAGKG